MASTSTRSFHQWWKWPPFASCWEGISIRIWRRGSRELGADSARCKNSIPPWWPKGGNLYGAAERLRGIRSGTSSQLSQEESIRPKAGTTLVVQEVRQLHPVDRLLQERWGPLSLHQTSSRWVSHRSHHLCGPHATLRSSYQRARQTRSTTAVEVCHERPQSGKTHSRHED